MPVRLAESHPYPAARTEWRGGETIGEKIWNQTDVIIHQQLNTAAEAIRLSGREITPDRLVSLVYATQEAYLNTAETDEWTTSQLTTNRIAQVMLEMPFAAMAHAAEDSGREATRRQTEERKNALVQFNHDFAATLAAMPRSMLSRFPEELWHRSARLMHEKFGLPVFPRAGFNARVQGVSREVAVSRALQSGNLPEGWSVRHAAIKEDRLGTDIIVYDEAGRALNIDVKAGGSYRQTVEALAGQRRLTEVQRVLALEDGYVTAQYGGTRVYLVDADRLGEISQFEFEKPEAVAEFAERLFEEQRQETLRSLGGHAIR